MRLKASMVVAAFLAATANSGGSDTGQQPPETLPPRPSASAPAITTIKPAQRTPLEKRPLTIARDNAVHLERFRKEIEGRENEPAGQVFKNVQYLKETRAGALLKIMDVGYSQGLGVACIDCHLSADFASEEPLPKRAAREMQLMMRSINDRLKTLEHTQGVVSAISCATCHRGQPIPLEFMPE